MLVALAWPTGSPLVVASVAVFGLCMIAVYVASTLMHLASSVPARRVLLECDHAAIYLLIAGTYTPLTLVALGGAWGVGLFVAVWVLALSGVALRLAVLRRRPRSWSVGMYLAIGWIGVVAAVPIVQSLSLAGVMLIFTGGAAYTAGVVFFFWHRLRFNHAIWHGFVCAGTALHFAAVCREVLTA